MKHQDALRDLSSSRDRVETFKLTNDKRLEEKLSVRVHLERWESTTRFRHELALDPAVENQREAVVEHFECSPVRSTMSRQLIFDPA